MNVRRLFPQADMPADGELFETLLETGNLRIERILSAPGSKSGPYDQEQDEWVLLMQGEAVLKVEGEKIELSAGDALLIPAHTEHSVLDTSANPPCIWLGLHLLR